MRPLLLTMGDPTGVGPELIIKALLAGIGDRLDHPLEVVGDSGCLLRAARIFTDDTRLETAEGGHQHLVIGERRLQIAQRSALDVTRLNYGSPDATCGRAMAEYVEYAIERCLTGTAAGIVTCPINKAAINASGYHFPGHTELLAERCGVDKVVMMLAGETLKVCLVTTHLAHRDIASRLTSAEIYRTIKISATTLQQQFGLKKPRLAVLALNPHAGENRLFGDEEERLILPAIRRAQEEGIAADGPHSADTLFHFAVRGAYDAVVCMYHDQGLIPLKLLHFDDAVNVTLGLPIVRTSVDHGTAYDLAGTGKANIASLAAALTMADRMAGNVDA
ncbi:MAG: 4-hydroxythreonine-4-phosphate dehydrogenase PdxA [Desulfuromonas sp.]|nr:MAG: 4-hydroxythreonine-4-phosphate dehydrogenase PdxA [Desulfuromonas sp.]